LNQAEVHIITYFQKVVFRGGPVIPLMLKERPKLISKEKVEAKREGVVITYRPNKPLFHQFQNQNPTCLLDAFHFASCVRYPTKDQIAQLYEDLDFKYGTGRDYGMEERALRTALQRQQEGHNINPKICLSTVKGIHWSDVSSLSQVLTLEPARYLVAVTIMFREPRFGARHWFALDTAIQPPQLADNLRERILDFDVTTLRSEREDQEAKFYVISVQKILKLVTIKS
jgi:hypothetical protein